MVSNSNSPEVAALSKHKVNNPRLKARALMVDWKSTEDLTV